MESRAHSNLKRFAAAYLLEEAFCAVGLEVRCPGSRYRVDAAGYLDHVPFPPRQTKRGETTLWATIDERGRSSRTPRCEPRTAIIECKQSRGDFIRDDKRADELISLRDEARRWKIHLEESRIKLREPELRECTGALFSDMESWDFARSRLPSYRKLLRRIARIEEQLYGQTKFCMMARYRVADQLYLLAPRALVRPRELPIGWGLIEVERSALRDVVGVSHHGAKVTVAAPMLRSPPRFRARLLRNIAVAATRTAFVQRPVGTILQPARPIATPLPPAGRTPVPA